MNTMFEEFLHPVSTAIRELLTQTNTRQLGSQVTLFDPQAELPQVDIAILGVSENRNGAIESILESVTDNPSSSESAADSHKKATAGTDQIRTSLYKLASREHKVKLLDLGNILPGHRVEDTYFALESVISELISKGIVTIILGGSQDLTLPQFNAYGKQRRFANLVCVDERMDLIDNEKIDSESYIWHILQKEPSYLFNYAHLAYQSHFVHPDVIHHLGSLYFDSMRLSELRDNMALVEPAVRDADLLSFDISSIRQADAPARVGATPNGLFGEEACRIMRYAGMSDKLSSVGLYEFEPYFDRAHQTSGLLAQMVWYFIDGYCNRKGDLPVQDESDFVKYHLHIETEDCDLTFWKSHKSGRWWMQVPYNPDKQEEKHVLLPCSYEDYQRALKQEVPDKWLRAVQRLNI